MNRDAVEEGGGFNLFARSGNCIITTFDSTGRNEQSIDEAVALLEQTITDWKEKGWNFAAATLQQFLDNNIEGEYTNGDVSEYIHQVTTDPGWRNSFMGHLSQKVLNGPCKEGVYTVGPESNKVLQTISSQELKTMTDLSSAYKEQFKYTFSYPAYGELYRALAGSHYAYYGTVTVTCDCGPFYMSTKLSLDLSVLMWDLTTYPSQLLKRKPRLISPYYRAAVFLESQPQYNHKDVVFALWKETGTWEQTLVFGLDSPPIVTEWMERQEQ